MTDIAPVNNSDDVVKLFEELKKEKYSSVIVIGFKDGCIHTKASEYEDMLTLTGALEMAKLDLWKSTFPEED